MDSNHDETLAALLTQAQRGDQDAYEKFLREASRVLRVFLSKRMGDIETMEDVLQDTLLAIHRARHSHTPGRPVGPWLYAICEHRMTDFFRRYRRIEKMEAPAPEDWGSLAATSDSREGGPSDRGALALEALERLPEKQRQVIELLKIHDLSVKEVSARIDMSESAVKVTAFRGYETIRRILGVKRK